MQLLAGIKTTKQQIQQLETEIEQLKTEVNQEEQEAQPENVHLSLWNKIKNTGIKLSRTFTSRSRRRIGALPMSVSARLEAVKQSQEL
jgi:capsule polysaccharide export protein KpsE/RkpR